MRRSSQEQVAFDRGMGRRGISYDRNNPYDETVDANLHAAWFAGWDHEHTSLMKAAPAEQLMTE